MSRVASLLACLLLAASFCAAQDAAPSSAPAARTAIPTQLAKSLDVKKLKVGDEVTTKTTVGLHMPNMLIPSGSTVVGHVTSVQSKAKGDPQSSLGITFDKIEISGGKSVPIHGVIQAVGPSLRAEPNTGAAGSGTLAKETGQDQGSTMPGPTGTIGPVGSTRSASPQLIPNGTGVLGIRNLELDKDAVLVSSAKDLKLDSGTQIMIGVEMMPAN
jgi:hypothetical protein